MRLIDADAMIADLRTVNPKYRNLIEWGIRVTKAQKTVDPARYGSWVKVSANRYRTSARYAYRCTVCNEVNYGWTKYCPNCGAQMRKENEI